MEQAYIYSTILAVIVFVLLCILIYGVSTAVKIAVSHMEKEADALTASYNDIVDFIHTHESKEGIKAIRLYLNSIDGRVNALLVKANYSDISRERYAASVKKLEKLKKHIDKTYLYTF